MPDTRSTPWGQLRVEYNRREGTTFRTTGALLGTLYAKHQSTRKVGDFLEVDEKTVVKKMRKLGLEPGPRFGDLSAPRSLIARSFLRIPEDDLKQMEAWQIAERLGCPTRRVNELSRRYKRPYKKRSRRKR